MKYRYHAERKDTMRDVGEFTQQTSVQYPQYNTAKKSHYFSSRKTSPLCSINNKVKINVIRDLVFKKPFKFYTKTF